MFETVRGVIKRDTGALHKLIDFPACLEPKHPFRLRATRDPRTCGFASRAGRLSYERARFAFPARQTSARCQHSSCHSRQRCGSPFDTLLLPVRNSEVHVPSRKPKEDACRWISSKQVHKNPRDRIEEHCGASVAVSQNYSFKRRGRTSRLAYRFYFRCASPSRAAHPSLYHYVSCKYTTRGGTFIAGEWHGRTLYT